MTTAEGGGGAGWFSYAVSNSALGCALVRHLDSIYLKQSDENYIQDGKVIVVVDNIECFVFKFQEAFSRKCLA